MQVNTSQTDQSDTASQATAQNVASKTTHHHGHHHAGATQKTAAQAESTVQNDAAQANGIGQNVNKQV